MRELLLLPIVLTFTCADPEPLYFREGTGAAETTTTTTTGAPDPGATSTTTTSTTTTSTTTGAGGMGGSGGEGGAGGEGGVGGAGGGAPLGTLGAPCEADGECVTDRCLFMLPGEQWGVCANFCDEGAACGEGESCYPAQIDGHLYCWRHCDSPLPCEPGSPGCDNDVDGTNGGYFCVPL